MLAAGAVCRGWARGGGEWWCGHNLEFRMHSNNINGVQAPQTSSTAQVPGCLLNAKARQSQCLGYSRRGEE